MVACNGFDSLRFRCTDSLFVSFCEPKVSSNSGTAHSGHRHPSRSECRRTCSDRRPEFINSPSNTRIDGHKRVHMACQGSLWAGRSRFSRCLSLPNTAVVWRRGTNTAVMLGLAASHRVQFVPFSISHWFHPQRWLFTLLTRLSGTQS
jgi:hypothetical protein